MTFPKTLLVSPTPPGTKGVGEAFLREICLLFPVDSLKFFFAKNLSYAMPGNTNDIPDLPITAWELPQELLVADSKLPIMKDISLRKKRSHYRQKVEELIEKIVAYGKKENCRQVVFILASPTLILMAEAVAQALNADLFCLVWDPPETTMNYLQFEPELKVEVMEKFARLLKLSKGVSVASNGMKEEYRSRYGIEGVPLIRPVRQDRIKTQRTAALKETKEISIGFSGSLYAMQEFITLMEALSSSNWNIAGRAVTLKMYGNYFCFRQEFLQKNLSLRMFGYRDQLYTVDALSKCHVAYLPYWFDDKYSLSVRTCFPDKLGTYLCSGAPVLYHGPEKSTPTEFFRKYAVGAACHSLSHLEILKNIERLVTDEEFRDSAWEAKNQALEKEYSLSEFRARIASFLSVDSADLRDTEATLTAS